MPADTLPPSTIGWGPGLTLWTIRLSLVLFASVYVIRWARVAAVGQLTRRWLWTCGWLAAVAHTLLALHFHFAWSHAEAVLDTAYRTRQQLGWEFGAGVYFNYVFLTVWGVDVAWWWYTAAGQQRIPFSLALLRDGFLLTIAFNGAVVFASGPMRYGGGVATAIIVAVPMIRWFIARRLKGV